MIEYPYLFILLDMGQDGSAFIDSLKSLETPLFVQQLV